MNNPYCNLATLDAPGFLRDNFFFNSAVFGKTVKKIFEFFFLLFLRKNGGEKKLKFFSAVLTCTIVENGKTAAIFGKNGGEKKLNFFLPFTLAPSYIMDHIQSEIYL